MADYNPDEMAESAEGADEYQGGLTAEITNIGTGTAGEFFGPKTEGDSDKEMLEVTAELPSGDNIISYFSTPNPENPELSWVNPTFRLARFRARYGDVPRVGQTVDVTVDVNSGFLGIALAEPADVTE